MFVGHCVLEYKRLTFSQLVRVHARLQNDITSHAPVSYMYELPQVLLQFKFIGENVLLSVMY